MTAARYLVTNTDVTISCSSHQLYDLPFLIPPFVSRVRLSSAVSLCDLPVLILSVLHSHHTVPLCRSDSGDKPAGSPRLALGYTPANREPVRMQRIVKYTIW